MFLFPIVYILSFIYAVILLTKKNINGVLFFIIIALPLYINTLCVTYMYGFEKMIPFLQGMKELSIFIAFGIVIWNINRKPSFHLIDKLIAAFFILSFIYLILPIGTYDFASRLIAFKALSIFPIIYFTGRFCKVETININRLFSYICLIFIVAAIVLIIFEVIPYQHLQTRTGFMAFHRYYFNAESSGSYGLIWTFETESGIKRFASIFSSPLELSSSSILTLCVLLALVTTNKNKIKFTNFYIASFLATLTCIIFALSRASLVNYFIVIYIYGLITYNKRILFYFHLFFLIIVIYIFFFLEGDLYEFIVTTLTFENSSSLGHVLEWISGANAIITHPFGLGLGASGRVSMDSNEQIGGENQLIIIGVQVGIIILGIYIWAYILMIKTGLKAFKTAVGKKKKLILCVVLIKIGIIIPLVTSYIDTLIYLTYTTYFLSGLMINMIVNDQSKVLVSNKELPNSSSIIE